MNAFLWRFVPRSCRDRFERVPTKFKALFCVVWVGWKFVALGVLCYLSQSNDRPKQSVLFLVTTPVRTETFTSNVARSIVNLEQHFDVFVNWIVADANDEFAFWKDAMPISASLYRQERFVLKDSILAYDLFIALYDEHVVVSHEIVQDYLAKSYKLMSDPGTPIDYLPYVAIDSTPSLQQLDTFDHPQFGLSKRIDLSSQGESHWGWMATPQQIVQLYRQDKFHLPPFEDNIAGNSDSL